MRSYQTGGGMKDGGMDGDIAKLVQILKKILKNHPGGPEIAKFMDEKSFNVNLCFFTFVPMTPEELEDLETMYEEYMMQQKEPSGGKKKAPKLEFRLNPEDVDFLKKHGLCF